jgi:hypothetical protein
MRRPAIAFAPRAIFSAGICLGLSIILSSCYFTSVGHWNEDSYLAQPYGNWRTVHVCVYLDEGVSKERALSLMSDWTSQMASPTTITWMSCPWDSGLFLARDFYTVQ